MSNTPLTPRELALLSVAGLRSPAQHIPTSSAHAELTTIAERREATSATYRRVIEAARRAEDALTAMEARRVEILGNPASMMDVLTEWPLDYPPRQDLEQLYGATLDAQIEDQYSGSVAVEVNRATDARMQALEAQLEVLRQELAIARATGDLRSDDAVTDAAASEGERALSHSPSN